MRVASLDSRDACPGLSGSTPASLAPALTAFGCPTQVMDFLPGEHLFVKEVHYNQHGLLLLQGKGIYRCVAQGSRPGCCMPWPAGFLASDWQRQQVAMLHAQHTAEPLEVGLFAT